MKKKTTMRVLLAVLSLTMLLCVLTGCFGSTSTESGVKVPMGESATEQATYAAELLKTDSNALKAFIAASRGYNMYDPNFKDSDLDNDGQKDGDLPAADLGFVHIEAAKVALTKVQPTDATYLTKIYKNLDADMVHLIVKAIKTGTVLVNLDDDSGFMVWIGKFLGLLTNITGGYYVLALFFFAIVVEILLLYFSIKQQKNSIKQARMSPKERAIRKKYAGRNDQVSMRKMQEEIQRLYSEEGFNPMGGCLPLLIQMPILIMLYNIVIDPLHYVMGKTATLSNALSTFVTTPRAAGGLGMTLSSSNSTIGLLNSLDNNPAKLEALKNFDLINNSGDCANTVSKIVDDIPNFSLFGLDMGATPSFTPADNTYLWLILIPILTFVAYFFSMKINRKLSYQPAMAAQNPQMGCSNNMMDITMPLMSVFICFMTPAAIGVYWIFKCLIGVGKQYIIHKAMPLPVFTEEDYKQAEKEIKAKSKGQRLHTVVQDARGQQYRSLHHIDDEDDLPPRENTQRTAVYIDEEDEMPKIIDPKPGNNMAAPMKKDRKNDRNE